MINHIIDSLHHVCHGRAKLPQEVLDLPGFCPPNIRRFLSNLCAFPECNYLEVGTFQGASLISAAYRNAGKFTGIDNFSEFDGARNTLDANLSRFPSNITFVEGDCWGVDRANFKDVNVYLYDGNHSRESQKKGITHFYPCLANEFVLLVDDYSWSDPRTGTAMALEELKPKVLFRLEIHDDNNEVGWWNGLAVFWCRK